MSRKIKSFIILAFCLQFVVCASSNKNIQQKREEDPRYQYNMGLFYLNNGNADEAIKCFHKSLQKEPSSFLTHNAMGLAYLMKHELEKSLQYFKKTLQINPKFSEAHNYLGTVYQEMGMLDEAEKEYRFAIADLEYKSKELPYYNLARLSLLKEEREEALTYVDRALEYNKSLVMAYNLKGIILERMEKFEEAIESYKSGLKYAPDDMDLQFNLAVAHFKNNEQDKAKNIFEKLALQSPDPEMKVKINEYLSLINRKN
ncbi:MAG: tetratricopeptide repeat protein [Acidobacteriota bacterium]